MDGIPVADVDTSGTTSTLAYVTADQLGTPRAIATSTGTTEWQLPYQGNPWNEVAPTTTGYVYNLRFPGQYYDEETSVAYNYYRNYDPTVGRYLQSDPIGLTGGLSTYNYVTGNPLYYSDSKGQCPWCVGAVIGAVAGGIAGYESGNGWKGAAIGALVGGAIGAAAPWASTAVGGAVADVTGSVFAGQVATVTTFAGINAAGAATGTVVTNAVTDQPLSNGVGTSALIGASTVIPEGMAIAAEVGGGAETAWSVLSGLTNIAVNAPNPTVPSGMTFTPLTPVGSPIPSFFSPTDCEY